MGFHDEGSTYVAHVTIKVANLARSLTFYQEVIGFNVLEETESTAVLTADGRNPLLSLQVPIQAEEKKERTTGLYHFALLLPERKELGDLLYHLAENGIEIGAADHLVSEAIYLSDPDGNGIELYRDCPSTDWRWEGQSVAMATDPLRYQEIISQGEQARWTGLPKNTVMGHIHLHVAHLEEARTFYTKGLGFKVVNEFGGQALFLSTGGYHHHIGLNTWNGVGAPKPAPNSAGLDSFLLRYPTLEERNQAVQRIIELGSTIEENEDQVITFDPSGNQVILSS